jgi:uncharacterized protein YcbK (DUF882 family)
MSEWDSQYFNREEFACKCGCGLDTVDYELLKVLEYIRENFGEPITINSGCRCPAYNDSLPNSGSMSQHLLGRAADIVVRGVDPQFVYELADQMEVGGLGEYSKFTHIDTRTGHARW